MEKLDLVEFDSPGELSMDGMASIVTSREAEWKVDEALAFVSGLKFTPYRFRFVTRERDEDGVFQETAASGYYWLGGKVIPLEEFKQEFKEIFPTLIRFMESEGEHRVVRHWSPNGYYVTDVLRDGDGVIEPPESFKLKPIPPTEDGTFSIEQVINGEHLD